MGKAVSADGIQKGSEVARDFRVGPSVYLSSRNFHGGSVFGGGGVPSGSHRTL